MWGGTVRPAVPAAPTTKRAPGGWNVSAISGERLQPEVAAEIPWLSPERFRALVHQVGAGAGYSSQNDVKQPDVVVIEKDLALDRRATRRRMFPGIALGVAGAATIAFDFAFLPTFESSFFLLLLFPIVGALLGASGFTLALQSEWQSDVIRVRLDPDSVRATRGSGVPRTPGGPLRLRVFSGRVASSTTSTKSGSYRGLVRVLPGTEALAHRFADSLVALAPLEAAKETPPPSARGPARTAGRADPNLVPQESGAARPIWYAYPERFNTLRAVILIVPMMFLIWGPMLLLLPWDYQHVGLTNASSTVQGIPPESWSPTGSTPGELYWSTYDAVTDSQVGGVPVTIALCPVGSLGIGTSTCQAPLSGANGADQGDLSLSIPSGWHLVVSENTTALCGQCKTSVTFDSPSLAVGIPVTIAGVAVAVPGGLYWFRLRARVRSSWPE